MKIKKVNLRYLTNFILRFCFTINIYTKGQTFISRLN